MGIFMSTFPRRMIFFPINYIETPFPTIFYSFEIYFHHCVHQLIFLKVFDLDIETQILVYKLFDFRTLEKRNLVINIKYAT